MPFDADVRWNHWFVSHRGPFGLMILANIIFLSLFGAGWDTSFAQTELGGGTLIMGGVMIVGSTIWTAYKFLSFVWPQDRIQAERCLYRCFCLSNLGVYLPIIVFILVR